MFAEENRDTYSDHSEPAQYVRKQPGLIEAIDVNTSARQEQTVLVVDDEPVILRCVSQALTRAGYRVMLAGSGQQALTMVSDTLPRLAIVDLTMPGLSGFELIRALRKQAGLKMHVTVLSGTADSRNRLKAFDAGADDFVAKPVPVTELVRRLDVACQRMKEAEKIEKLVERTDQLLLYASEAAALVAHDLNNGLAVASANLQFLSEAATLDPDSRDALVASQRVLARMAGLAANFVDISRLEDCQMTPKYQRVEVKKLISSAVSTQSASSDNSDGRFQVRCDPDLFAEIDPALIERVLLNLVGNAIRYAGAAGSVQVHASRELGKDDEWLVLEIANDGARIPPHHQSRLFQKYGTGGDKLSVRGMGLYFCRLASEAHGGTIALDPQRAMTTFVVRIPLKKKEK